MTLTQHTDHQAALAILNATGVPVLEAAILAKEALAANRGSIRRARRCLAAGAEALRQQDRTVSFEQAVAAALEARKDRRTRTLYDFRYFTRLFMKRCAGLARRRVRSITPQECSEYIDTAFDTPRQRQKARLILSGVFSTAMKRGWCDANPVSKVEAPRVVEQPVPVLTPQEIEQLTTTAEAYQGGSCAAAVGMMLYAGIRPHEVARLTWAQVDLQEQAIYILPRHSKTGGARRVTIHQPLLRILRAPKHANGETICPPNWLHHWRELRRAASWNSPARR
jgi:integrase